ncbi:DsrE/DsrF/TusD sulfur relay family protein [Natrinema salifodinae]|uniref:tRNA 2-thiouridine synthesizing protein D n=1 Tax=Natrinema salifodinae TaxID=1202768 RepID=A0A1I0QR43_9EURY|nr:DsrE family protein [Natrinema salifodinae]SEW30029.1 tRNA 2-thiouridine synthesizing protein D [Natrinema salifodinae]
MIHLGVLLTGSPFDSERWRTAYELGRAALNAGHAVTYFHYLDGAYVPVTGQHLPDCSDAGLYDEMPTEKFQELIDDGAEVICCGLCVNARGIDADAEYPDGVEVGLLPDLADILGDADRVISL